MPLKRYRAIIPDWDLFQATIASRDPTTFRVRTGRTSLDEVVERLRAQGFVLEPVEGLPDFMRVLDGPHSVADTVENWLGMFYIQQASTGVVAPILDPRPGERLLDMCAAPGGKTTHAADLMEDSGCIVAVDRNEDRIRALLGNLYRTAHPNVLVVAGDGRALPDGALFDRVLVDAPCSAEGTLRRKGGRVRVQPKKFRRSVPKRQEGLLRRAIALTRPGGTVLYSTCTFAPEENEAVVSRVLEDAPVVLEPISMEAPHAPGLTSFEGQQYHPSLEGACRIYPHHLDSGGLFVAKLRRLDGEASRGGPSGKAGAGTGGGPSHWAASGGAAPYDGLASAAELPGWSSVPTAFPDGRTDSGHALRMIDEGKARLQEFFDVDESAFEGLQWMVRGDDLWVHRCDGWPLGVWGESDRWRVVSVGLRAMVPDYKGRPRPTNDLLRLLEGALAQSLVSLSRGEWKSLLEGSEVDVPGVQSGFVPLGLDDHVAGRGLVRGEHVKHEIPKVQAKWLAKILGRDAAI